MNISRLIIPAVWLLSIASAFIIGSKVNSPSASEASSDQNASTARAQAPSSRGSSANPDSSSRRSTLSRQKSTRSARDLNITNIASSDDPIARASDLLELINSLGPNDFQQVVADFRALGITRDRMSEYGMLLHAWAKVDPLSALDYASEHTGTPFARQTILASWAGNDPNGAVMWAKDHHKGEGANPWLVGVIRGIATTDPTRATEVLHDLPYSRERGEALNSIIPHIAQKGHDEATRWLETIGDEKLLNGATAYLAASLAKTNPETTAEWINSLAESDAKTRAVAEVASQWANQDLPAAVAWTDNLGGEAKTNAAGRIIGDFARENPTEAAGWLSSMSGEPGYERVVQSYIWNTARSNPEASLAQVSELQDTRSQYRYYERILRRWKGSDPDAVEAWMNNNQVSDELRDKVNK